MNHSSFDPDDDKLTAFALGELPEEADRAAVERLLADSPEARAAVEEIRSLAALLVAEYESERQTHSQAETAVAPASVVPFLGRGTSQSHWWTHPALKLAAVVFILAGVGSLLLPMGDRRGDRSIPSAARTAQAPALTDKVSENSPASSPASQAEPAPPIPPDARLALNKEPAATQSIPAATPAPQAFSESLKPAESAATAAAAAPKLEEQEPLTLAASASKSAVGPVTMDQNRSAAFASRRFTAPAKPQIAAVGSVARSEVYTGPVPANAKRGPVPQSGVAYGGASAKESVRGGTELASLKRAREMPAAPGSPAANQGQLSVDASSAAAAPASAADKDSEMDASLRASPADSPFNTATYDHIAENPFLAANENPFSTFSIDVDTASYANVRRFIEAGALPPKDAVRIEELLNYFPYSDAPPAEGDPHPFAIHLEAADCPWNLDHRLVRIGIKGREMAADKRPVSNLVFLIDVSGSMMPPERLPLIKESLRLLVEKLTENDHVAIVVYAGNSGLALPSTSGDHKERILEALGRLEAGGSTNGADGIRLAYKVAQGSFIKGGVNRVILATDGDFNVGITSQGELIRLIEKEAKSGIFLSALGVGTDNYKDSTMQKLADHGNGNYAYIDRLEEARKVLFEQMSSTLVTIAKDVKIQVEFNPAAVGSYRLIGYEKRLLRKEDFNDDKVDAGEIGAGHSVTALYEIIPAAGADAEPARSVDVLKYQSTAPAAKAVEAGNPGELLTVKMRYKAPDAEQSQRAYEQPLQDHPEPGDFAKASTDFKFAAAVAGFGLELRDSPYKGNITFGAVVELAQDGKGSDASGYRAQFIDLVRHAQELKDRGR